MRGDTAAPVHRAPGPLVLLVAIAALWSALAVDASAKTRPVLILPFQGSETDAWRRYVTAVELMLNTRVIQE